MQRPLLSVCLGTLLSLHALPAQGLGGATGSMPMLPPIAGLLAQPLGGTNTPSSMPGGCSAAGPAADPATTGPQRTGKDLSTAIAKVTALTWLDDLDEARLESAATGKPILWLQALGDLEGFA